MRPFRDSARDYVNPAAPFHVVRNSYGKFLIVTHPFEDHVIEHSASSYGECQKFIYVAEKRHRQAQAFASFLIWGAGMIGAAWLFAMAVRAF